MGCVGNRHLHYLAESIYVNVGGFHRDAKASSRPMPGESVGAAIVVGGHHDLLTEHGKAVYRAKGRSLSESPKHR